MLEETKFATMLIPIVAAKKANAATIVNPRLPTLSTISVGFVNVSPNTTTVPAVNH